MKSSAGACMLQTASGENVALQGVDIQASLKDLLGEVTISQTYSNTETANIEAVYTFPLPSEAVLLDLTVKIGERTLKGLVIEKSDAEEKYEEAITDGDKAIMLEHVKPGIYTMNVGNLLPGESVTISFTYSLLHSWQGDVLRFYLPTTIAPRYGDASSVGYEPHQIPEHSILHENRFSLQVRILGILKDSLIECPTHQITKTINENETIIRLRNNNSVMDRDFVLTIKKSDGQFSSASYVKDLDGYVVLASFYPRFPDLQKDNSPRNIKIVLDCSGSMQGDSIVQSQIALKKILDSLREQDYFNIIRFGDDYNKLFETQVRADAKNLAFAKTLLRSLEADMDGTEMENALKNTCAIPCPEKLPADVMLITDGEINNNKQVIRIALKSRHRFFTVGVGSSVNEALLCTLAEITGGASEFVTPNEKMAEKIFCHFKRIYAPCAKDVTITWHTTPLWISPEINDRIFDGDTVHVYACFKDIPDGTAELKIKFEDGTYLEQSAEVHMFQMEATTETELLPPLARLAAHHRIKNLNDTKTITGLALHYQLMTEYTNYLIIDKSKEGLKAEDLPAVRKVPQTLAAGWHGIGKIDLKRAEFYSMRTVKSSTDSQDSLLNKSPDIPDFLRKEVTKKDKFKELILDIDIKTFTVLKITNFKDLENTGLQKEYIDKLRELVDAGFEEKAIVRVFLYFLIDNIKINLISKYSRRIITKSYKSLPKNQELYTKVYAIVNELLNASADSSQRRRQNYIGILSKIMNKMLGN